ncbi:glycosyl hydrolase 53 family protein [Reichenbachiella agarivorans]|uniref:Arabinogalactan endo-beta-1,4-galactanase n=1 Tax=Reichenbachiella agarivorans TaxID=2979464 RepID=A0ABY6CU47_9BACT|nr:glycosyl hydrolase 53 family protein [Reichenbachiella agarivorans]UXP34008.1 glycosyl hydrolase 53 family protein [Reichenbachiella agarivorans]
MRDKTIFILLTLFLFNCSNNEPEPSLDMDEGRKFKMGFSTWVFGPTEQDRNETYSFIQSNGDIYSEQVDDRIPWNSWINDLELPIDFVQSIDDRVNMIDKNLSLVLSISPLNTSRNDLKEDWDGLPIEYNSINELKIEDAYFKHVEYLVGRFNPKYLVSAMEPNDLLINSTAKWADFKLLASNVRSRLKTRFPSLLISESITLHNYFQPQVDNPSDYIQEVSDYSEEFDFIAISFYPFFKNLQTIEEYQEAFDFLHNQFNKPIAFVETSHLSGDLVIPNLNTNITGSLTRQKEYLETLVSNAHTNNYEFIIWWAHRDYDALWETFPDEVKDIGQVWRDTGLLDEDGVERPAFSVWTNEFQN